MAKIKQDMINMKNKNGVGTVLMTLMSILCAVIAALLLFVPSIDARALCYTFCTGLILWGILQISKFFLVHAYRKLNDYSFSVGVLLVVLGCCGMIRMDEIIAKKDICFGLITLCIGILVLQSTIQLNALQSAYWTADLVVAAVIILCSVFIVTDTTILVKKIPSFSEWILLLSGICSAVNIILVAATVHQKEEYISNAEFSRDMGQDSSDKKLHIETQEKK